MGKIKLADHTDSSKKKDSAAVRKPVRKPDKGRVIDVVFTILVVLSLLFAWAPQVRTIRAGEIDSTVTDYQGNETKAQVYSVQYTTDGGKQKANTGTGTYPCAEILLPLDLSRISEFMCDADSDNVYFDVKADGRTLARIDSEKYDNMRLVFPYNAYYVGKTFPELLQLYKDKGYLVIFALSEAGSETMSPEVKDLMSGMGFTDTPSDVQGGSGWIGIWNGGKVVSTVSKANGTSYEDTVAGHSLKITSTGAGSTMPATLSLDGFDYGAGQTGLCLLVYDTENSKLIDSCEYSADAMATLNRNNQFFKIMYRPVYKSQFISHVNAVYTADANVRHVLYTLAAIVLALLWMSIRSVRASIRAHKEERKAIVRTRKILLNALIVLAGVLAVGWHYLYVQFSGIEIQQLIYHATTNNTGTNWGNFLPLFIQFAVAIAIAVALSLMLGKVLRMGEDALAGSGEDKTNAEAMGSDKPKAGVPRRVWGAFALRTGASAVMLCAIGWIVYSFCDNYKVFDYLVSQAQTTQLYDDYYADAATTKITFPEKKKNLIYIYLESMEITPADTSIGGGKAYNGIPELASLALDKNNDDFNGDSGKLNGGLMLGSTSWTVAGMVAQTSGVPLNIPSGGNKDDAEALVSLPGVTSLGDVLEDNGYHNVLFIGSDANFANRRVYFENHGNYDIDDYYWAIKQGLIPKNYYVWWGYEDKKLFDFAKDEANTLADSDQPFNLTLLTTDTHFSNGYVCDDCPTTYPDQYANVIACSSKRVADFVEWCSQQSWYDNTVIILSGDHLYMDQAYYKDAPSGYQRKTYVTVVNSAKEEPAAERSYCTLDLFPTTLSAMGCTIDGDRLGLGTDLYSDTPTLTEKLGKDAFNYQLGLRSDYYDDELAPHKSTSKK
jgi:hypothetical protein